MKVNYNKLFELNKRAIVGTDGGAMGCFWVLQLGVEKFLNGETLNEAHKNLLLNEGVLELTEEEKASQTIVGPFKFNHDGVKETN